MILRDSNGPSPEREALVQKVLFTAVAIGTAALALVGFRELIDYTVERARDGIKTEFEVPVEE